MERVSLRKYSRRRCNVFNKKKGMKTVASRPALLLGGFNEMFLERSSQTFPFHLVEVECFTSSEIPLHHSSEKVDGFGCPVF